MIVLLTGGSGCGKSTYAESLFSLLPTENRVYIATMRVYDEESVRRVKRHRAQRAALGFCTLECPKHIQAAQLSAGGTALLEDLPNWLANEMFCGGDWARIQPALQALCKRCAHLVVVTNDVFSDGVRYPAETQAYLRRLAELNRYAAKLADTVVEVVYSLPVPLKGALPCVPSHR